MFHPFLTRSITHKNIFNTFPYTSSPQFFSLPNMTRSQWRNTLLNLRRGFLATQPQRRFATTAVMSFGDGSQGALGLGLPPSLSQDAYEPTKTPALPPDIAAVAAGHYHSLAVTSQGHVWSWGRNNEYQLGRELGNEPMRVQGLDHVIVQRAFASGVVSAAIGLDGSLWVWGKSKRGQLGLGKGITEARVPSKVEGLVGESIVKVSFGWGHALAMTEDGKLFGWGYSADGRLGKIGKYMEVSPLEMDAGVRLMGSKLSSKSFEIAEKFVLEGMEKEKDMPIAWEPHLVEELHGSKVVDIACGLDHTLVLCSNGTLLSCGSNVYGQLGRRNRELGLLPVDISLHPLSIASGLGHSMAICQSDVTGSSTTIATWGWNCNSQLGRAGPESLPQEIEGLAEETIISVSGGRVHSFALTSRGEVWAWGCGKNGRLGMGSSTDESEPIFLDSMEGLKVLQVASGFDHALVLVAE